MAAIHSTVGRVGGPRSIWWHNHRPSNQEHTPLARHMAEAAQAYERTSLRKVPRWIIRFALHSLSLDPLPLAPVIADCLTIVAIDLGCSVSNTTISNDSGKVERISTLICQKLESLIEAHNPILIRSKHKPISGLIPYAIRLGQSGQQGITDMIIRASVTSIPGFRTRIWHHVPQYIARIFDEPSPPSLNRSIILISPFVAWRQQSYNKDAVIRWAAAVLAVPFAEELGPSVIDALLQIGNVESLRSHIPIEVFAWLDKRPALPPGCQGPVDEFRLGIFRCVRGLRDIELLKSYLLLIWSERQFFSPSGLDEMEMSIREAFGGIWMWGHRKDLIGRLNHVLSRFKGVDEDYNQRRNKVEYRRLLDVLMGADRRTMEILTVSHLTFTCALPLL